MRLTLAATILVVAIAIPIVGKDSVHTPPHADHSDRSDQPPKQTVPVVQTNTDGTQPKQTPPAKPVDSSRDQNDVSARKMLYLTVCLAVSTFALAVFGVFQAIATWRTAKGLIAIERAQLAVDMNRFDAPQELLNRARGAIQTARIDSPASLEISIPFINYGRTTAWVTEWSRNSMVRNRNDANFALDYRVLDSAPEGTPFPPGEQRRPFYFFVDWRIQNTSDVNDIDQGRSFLYVYGFVKYRDAFNKARETYFCVRFYRDSPSFGVEHIGWELAGPRGANRYT